MERGEIGDIVIFGSPDSHLGHRDDLVTSAGRRAA